MIMSDTMFGLKKEQKGTCAPVWHDDLPIPEPKDDEVLVKVNRAALCGTDIHIIDWDKWSRIWVKPPVIMGHEACGEVVLAGKNVTDRKPGDRVAFESHIPCGKCPMCVSGKSNMCMNMSLFGVGRDGAFAEYVAAPEKITYKLTDDISDDVGCLFEPMGSGIRGVEKAEVEGKNVLVSGCGAIGLTVIAGAKTFGAEKVIACDILPERLKDAEKMGADITVNSSETDIISFCRDLTGGLGVDAAIDVTGAPPAIVNGIKALKNGGRLVGVGFPSGEVGLDLTNDVYYREVEITGVCGRRIWETWDNFAKVMRSPYFDASVIIGGTYALHDFEKAVEAYRAGVPGKKLFRIE